jgi:hypothetical protein
VSPARTAATLPLLALLAGCAEDPAEQMLGAWTGSAGRMEFYPDGQVLLQPDDSTASLARYRLGEKGLLRLTVLGSEGVDYRLRVNRDSLVLCRAGQDSTCYHMARAARR